MMLLDVVRCCAEYRAVGTWKQGGDDCPPALGLFFKGQFISKYIFGAVNSPEKTLKQFDLR